MIGKRIGVEWRRGRGLLGWLGRLGLTAGLALAACGDSGAGGVPAAGDGVGASDGAAGVDGAGAADPWAAAVETDAWRILHGYRGRLTTNAAESELWMLDADGANAQALTTFGGLKDLDPPMSCQHGCFVSPDMKWIAVVSGPPSEAGYTVSLGKIGDAYQVTLLKGGELEGLVHFEFAGDRFIYSKKTSCTGASCQYGFHVIELADNVNEQLAFLDFPIASDLEGSTYKGRFRVSPDGSVMVLLRTTIRSVNVYMWKDGLGLVELDFMCKFGTRENCTGTGSEYSDADPVAISQDNRYVAYFAFADRWHRIHVYDTTNPELGAVSIVASVGSGSYIEQACDPGVLQPWQWQKTVGSAFFTPDSSELVFLGETRCAVDGVEPPKPGTDLRRIKVATLLEGRTLREDDIFNITKNATGDVTLNRRVDAFGLSPDGATAVFVATPTFDQSGNLIADGAARQRNDREVFRVRLDGSNIQQLTNDISFAAESPMAVPLR
jgi:hypothetical protein